MPIQRDLNHSFFSSWSPEMAYVLGYFAADGSMIEHKNGGKYIEFTSTDLILLENLRMTVDSNHAITERTLRSKNCQQSWRIQIGSNQWFKDLLKWGFTPNKSNTLKFPNVPPELLGDFTRGYFDGDGCVYFANLKYADRSYKRWVLQTLFTSGSCEFLKSLHALLQSHGLKKGAIAAKSKSGYELKFSHKDSLALYKFMYHTGQVSTLFLPRKREKLETAIQALGLDKPYAAVA